MVNSAGASRLPKGAQGGTARFTASPCRQRRQRSGTLRFAAVKIPSPAPLSADAARHPRLRAARQDAAELLRACVAGCDFAPPLLPEPVPSLIRYEAASLPVRLHPAFEKSTSWIRRNNGGSPGTHADNRRACADEHCATQTLPPAYFGSVLPWETAAPPAQRDCRTQRKSRGTKLVAVARAHGNPLTASGAPARQHRSAALGLHAGAESVRLGTMAAIRLKCTFRHGNGNS